MELDGIVQTEQSVNGITLRVAEAGPEDGPLLILIHGWPELSYSWRYQIPVLAEAGYRVVAPDMRGYGGSDAPEAVGAYDIRKLTGDIAGLVELYGKDSATLIGHDWGAAVGWYAMLMNPELYDGYVAMSVPFPTRAPAPTTQVMKKRYGENFFYMLYFQEPGVAEAEFEADPRAILSKLYASPSTPRKPPEVTDPKASAGGFGPRLGEPTERPTWLSEEDLEYYVETFTKTGFHGGINYYRNLDRNWELTADLADQTISQPVLFIAGEKDTVIGGATKPMLETAMATPVPGLKDVILIPETGHWVQQEESEKVNELVLHFLSELHGSAQ
ncbi:MAG: epoxide hydrolase [Ponticaulis sp.]|nr:epoxide hydrolase [Ponticaulis sp.]